VIVLSMVVAATLAMVPARAVSKTWAFAGFVDVAGKAAVNHWFSVAFTGSITAELDWSGFGTDLELSLVNPSGLAVATSATSNRPERLTYDVTTGNTGTWRIVVSATSGASDYVAGVVARSGTTTTTTSPATSTTTSLTTTTTRPGSTTTTTRPATTSTTAPGPTTTTRPGPTTTLPPSGAGSIPVHAPEFMLKDHDVNESQAVELAKRFSFISAQRALYKKYVGKMKAANPNLTLLVYLIGTHLKPEETSGVPDAWFAKDSQGRRITSPYGFYLMTPSNADWINFVRQRCLDWRSYSGYDGCFLDTMGIAPTLPGYESALPINPATGKAWTSVEWIKATTNIASQVRAAISPRPMLVQGTAQGDRYWNPAVPTSQLLNGSDGSMIEMFLRSPEAGASSFPREARWKQDVDMVADHGARGKTVMAVTKLWSSATPEQRNIWHEYALASFLLGYSGSKGAFVFLNEKALKFEPQWAAQVGNPSGGYAKASPGYYQRTFTKGKVFVNPTSSTFTVALDGSYRTLDGRTVSSITLPPNRGAVLTKAA
jgi:hypothetical protein